VDEEFAARQPFVGLSCRDLRVGAEGPGKLLPFRLPRTEENLEAALVTRVLREAATG
jgi:hypothetical protein